MRQKRSIFSFLGVNGAGKSTTISMICGQLEKDSGKITICGMDCETHIEGISRKTGVVFQNSALDASLLRLNGIKAQHITCMPYEDPFDDCHVVVDCLLPSGERIMLDPTSRLYYKDEYGKYVSLPHLRELLIADKPIFENPDARGMLKKFHFFNIPFFQRNKSLA